LVNCQLSGGADYKPGRQAYEHAIVASPGPGETVKRAASHWVWLTRLKEAGSG
jgi:hypothetical protein